MKKIVIKQKNKNPQKTKRNKIISLIFLIAVLVVAIWTAWGNTALVVTEYTIESSEIPNAFDGFRIAHVSDLHDAEIGKVNEKLLEKLRNASPDIIAITGDLVDCHRPNVELSLDFVKEAVKIAPCYYVFGNHEAWLSDEDFSKLENGLLEYGVCILDDKSVFVEKEGQVISVLGLVDSDFGIKNHTAPSSYVSVKKIKSITDFSGYKILLSHRPQFFDNYAEAEVDLVLSGHAHGGQFRIPFLGGLYTPSQGLFPEYDCGIYTKNNTEMCVSRGIGNSSFPFRFNNRPEIVMIELKRAS